MNQSRFIYTCSRSYEGIHQGNSLRAKPSNLKCFQRHFFINRDNSMKKQAIIIQSQFNLFGG